MSYPKFFTLLLLGLVFLLEGKAQNTNRKSIVFEKISYSQHPLLQFRTIRNRDLPLTKSLDQNAPFPLKIDSAKLQDKYLFGYYTQTIQSAFQKNIEDRAIISDSLAPAILKDFKMPTKAYRLFTSRTKRYDKIKRIKYAIKKGIPVLVGLRVSPPEETFLGQSHWDGKGMEKAHIMLISGYDSKTASFQLMDVFGTEWGEKGFIWMTYLDLLSKAKEVVTLKNPTLSSNTTTPLKTIKLNLKASAAHFRQSEERGPQLEALTVNFNEAEGVYEFPDLDTKSDRDRFQLKLHIPKGRCAYLFTAHPDGNTTPAWSMTYHHRDTTIVLPPVSYYQFSEPGNEHFILLLSHKPLLRWRRYVDYYKYNERPETAKEKLYRAFERFLIPENKIEYSKNELGFSASFLPAKQYVVPLIIKWKID